MIWDALQRDTLAALGHTLYARVDACALRPDGKVTGAHVVDRAMQHGSDSGIFHRNTPEHDAASPDRLLHALLRAADWGQSDAPSLQSQLPSLPALIGNAAAKRALWPTLRALRAAPRPK